MPETMVRAGDVDICVETFGMEDAPPILLIAGASESMDSWDPDFCRLLADEGRFVIRYDHRDTGRSSNWPPGAPGYSGSDLVADAIAVIDLVAGGRAHLVGVSMGGAIAQRIAVDHPDRVATLTLIATTPGPAGDLPPVSERLSAAFASPRPDPDWERPDAVVDHVVEGYRPYAGPAGFDEARVRAAARRMVERTPNRGASAGNHWLLEGAGEVRPRLGTVRAPTLVVHGSSDPLFPLGHGEALAREIPGAELLVLDGVGHQAPPQSSWDMVVPAILRRTEHRVWYGELIEGETRVHDDRFRAATKVGPRDRVLDIGCGTGGSTRDAATAAVEGSVVGVDVAGPSLEEARRLSDAAGLSNVDYLRADAQVHPFELASFDLCISRFGSMFFTDAVAAFTNIGRALRPGARLVLLVWQPREENEWSGAFPNAAGESAPEAEAGSDPFSLGDPATVREVLAAAGFTDIALEDVRAPVCYGPDAATAFDLVLGFHDARQVLRVLAPPERNAALGRVRAVLAAHQSERGVLFDGRTWIVTAHRST